MDQENQASAAPVRHLPGAAKHSARARMHQDNSLAAEMLRNQSISQIHLHEAKADRERSHYEFY
jgi:hypothetical protein